MKDQFTRNLQEIVEIFTQLKQGNIELGYGAPSPRDITKKLLDLGINIGENELIIPNSLIKIIGNPNDESLAQYILVSPDLADLLTASELRGGGYQPEILNASNDNQSEDGLRATLMHPINKSTAKVPIRHTGNFGDKGFSLYISPQLNRTLGYTHNNEEGLQIIDFGFDVSVINAEKFAPEGSLPDTEA